MCYPFGITTIFLVFTQTILQAPFNGFTVLRSFSGVGLTSIGSSAFLNLKNLTMTELPENITSIGYSAFSGSSIALTSLPARLTTISSNAFQLCRNIALTSLPSKLESIGQGAFWECENLNFTDFPSSLTSIGLIAFTNNKFINISLPASVNVNSGNPFGKCKTLVSFTATGSGNLSVKGDGKMLIRNNTELVAYPSASGSVILPEEITSIQHGAFHGCRNLTQLTLPENITSIISTNGYTFGDCSDLVLLICLAPTPPAFEGAVFGFSPSFVNYVSPDIKIKVPAGSVLAYRNASGWSQYADIISAIE
jgi:hypothetical protein